MTRPVARYSIYYGLRGCYMPDSHYGAFEVTSRRDLANLIRSALADYDMPAARFADAKVRRLWSFIKHHGSSTAHFSLDDGASALQFSGITEQEYEDQNQEE